MDRKPDGGKTKAAKLKNRDKFLRKGLVPHGWAFDHYLVLGNNGGLGHYVLQAEIFSNCPLNSTWYTHDTLTDDRSGPRKSAPQNSKIE